MEKYNFDMVAEKVCLKSPEIIETLEKCRVECNLMSSDSFRKVYQVKFPSDPLDGIQQPPASFDEISEVFSFLNKMPPCFLKPRKLNATASKLNSSKRGDAAGSSKSNVLEDNDLDQAIQAYKDRKQKLQDVAERTTASVRNYREYQDAVNDLQRATRELKKFVPSEFDRAVEIFDEEEAKEIEELKESVDALVFVQENQTIGPVVETRDDKDLEVVFKMATDLL